MANKCATKPTQANSAKETSSTENGKTSTIQLNQQFKGKDKAAIAAKTTLEEESSWAAQEIDTGLLAIQV